MRLRVSRPQLGTCSWLMEQQAIKNWISNDGSNLIWLCGHPGFGKSVLARYLVDKLSEETDSSMTIFFFCSYSDDRTQDLSTLLSALIYQLVFDDPRLSRPVQKKYGPMDGNTASSEAHLWDILALVIGAPRRRTIFLVIDALDELARTARHELLEKLISHVRQSNGSVKLLITSRHEPEIGHVLGDQSVRLDLGKIADNRSDVETYLQQTVRKYGSSRSFGDDRTKIVVDEMVSRADGMFLWAKLAWTYFIDGVGLWTKSTLDRKIAELRQLPPGLDALYYRILTKVDKSYWHDIIHVLSWMAVAPRPLTTSELPIALALKERPRKTGDMEIGFNVPQFLGSCLPHLVEVHENGDVTPVHQSFKEFLTETTELFETRERNPFFINKYDANYEAGLSCLWYLGLEDYDGDDHLRSKLLRALKSVFFIFDTDELLPRYPFLHYSMDHWGSHLAASNNRQNQKLSGSLMTDLHDRRDEVAWTYFEKTLLHDDGSGDILTTKLDGRMRWAPAKPAIFTLYLSRLWGLLKQASLHGFDMNESGSPNFLPERERGAILASREEDTLVHTAFDGDDLEAISCLVSLGADVNARGWQGRTLLHVLVNRQVPDDVATWLAYPGVNVNAQNDEGDTPLHFATRNDRHTENILEILLATPGIDGSIKNDRGQDALTVAAHWGKFKATRRLLEVPGITLHHSSLPYQTESALINAAIQGWSEVVIDILNMLPSIDQFQDWSNRTILHWTVIRNLHGGFDIALDKQTHILDRPDIKGMTPLHYATDYGMLSMVEKLIQRGASTSERNKFGETPLHVACGHGDMPIVKLLLNHTPKRVVNGQDCSGWTAIHRALTSGDDDLAEWFSSQSTVSVHVRDKHGRLPIHFAAAYASRTMLQSFSQRFPSQVWATDRFGYTLLHMAVVGANRPNISYLLNHFPDMDPNAQNKWGKQPLDYARHESIKDMLLENGFRHSATHVKQLTRLYAHLVRSGSDPRIQHPERELVRYEEPTANIEEGTEGGGQRREVEEGQEKKDEDKERRGE